MQKKWRRPWIAMGVAMVAALAGGGATLGQSAAQATSPIEVSVTASINAGAITYSINIQNTGPTDVANIYIAGSVPAGAEFLGEAGTPQGSWFRGFEAANTSIQAAVWLSDKIPAKGSQGPFVYRVDKGKATDLSAHAWLHWLSPTDGTLLSADANPSLSLAAIHDVSSPRYNANCLSCHADVSSRTSLSPKVQDAHVAMMPFVPGYVLTKGPTNATCSVCHQGAELRDHAAGGIVRNTNPVLCTACHGPSGPGKKFYAQ